MSERYKEAGVDLEAGYESVRLIRSHVQRTHRSGVMSGIGAFGGEFDLSEMNLKEPVLVSGTDGVGTKLMIAQEYDKHDTIGIDAVAMCVNDVLVQGAEPLYFLDYIAIGKNDPHKVEQLVKGVADGCIQAGCALIGGETAEMPGMYDAQEYDIAGFCVGVVEKSERITGETVQEGDCIIGLASSGCHSNGYSLIRKLLLQDAKLNLHDEIASLGTSLGAALLEPTRIYVKPILSLIKKLRVKAMGHITGGGFYENIPRMLPQHLGAHIDKSSLPVLPIFDLLQEKSGMDEDEMYHVFNMGIGYMIIVQESDAASALAHLKSQGETAWRIGRVTKTEGVSIQS